MGKKKKGGKKRKKRGRKIKRKISWGFIFSYGNNLAINGLIAVFLASLVLLVIFSQRQLSLSGESSGNEIPVKNNENTVNYREINTLGWQKYQNLWYGFELQHPADWNKTEEQNIAAGMDWEYRYVFRKKNPDEMINSCFENKKPLALADWQIKYLFYKKDAEENNLYGGFDVLVYDVSKVKELTNTDEFVAVKNAEPKATGTCEQIKGHLSENENYPAEKIHILSDDDCYNSVFFYSLTREQYIYNIVPVFRENLEVETDLEKDALDNFPEFFSVASSFNLIDIKRPKVVPPKPRITAPKPVIYEKDSLGRRVCNKKNDHPGKSKKGKGKHLDMECCLDPDEYPNPWCYYSPEKYGKYLK